MEEGLDVTFKMLDTKERNEGRYDDDNEMLFYK